MSNRPSFRLLWLVLAIVTAGAALSGCGQNGPLYLPEDAEDQEDRSR